MDRRDFLKTTAVAAAGSVATASAQSTQSSPAARPESPNMIYRTLGRTGERISAIGLGGYHIGKSTLQEEESIQLMRRAIDEGITFLTIAGITTMGSARFAWARRSATDTATRSSL